MNEALSRATAPAGPAALWEFVKNDRRTLAFMFQVLNSSRCGQSTSSPRSSGAIETPSSGLGDSNSTPAKSANVGNKSIAAATRSTLVPPLIALG